MRPRLDTASTTSGSGLFQRETGCSPTSAPQPTADIGWPLVKTSASGPMPDLEVLRSTAPRPAAPPSPPPPPRCRAGCRARTAPISPAIRAADRLGLRRVAGGALLDHPLDHRAGEGHAAGLQRLQVAGREQPRPVLVPAPRRIGESAERAAPGPPRRQPPGRIVELQEVAHRRRPRGEVTSTTSPSRTASRRRARPRPGPRPGRPRGRPGPRDAAADRSCRSGPGFEPKRRHGRPPTCSCHSRPPLARPRPR